jgi:hypothetical protein
MSTRPESSGSSPGPAEPRGENPSGGGEDAAGHRAARAGERSGDRSREEPAFDPERAWRESFDAFERAIGRPMEAFVASEEFADAAAQFFKANARLQSELQQGPRSWSAFWNLPSGDDIRELRASVDDVRRQLGRIADRLDSIEAKLG